MLAYDDRLNKWLEYLIRVGLEAELASKIAVIVEEYNKPEHGKWDNNT